MKTCENYKENCERNKRNIQIFNYFINNYDRINNDLFVVH